MMCYQELRSHFKDLHTSWALSLPKASIWKRCCARIFSSCEGNNTTLDAHLSCFWAESSGRWHLFLFCCYENQTSADFLLPLWKRQVGRSHFKHDSRDLGQSNLFGKKPHKSCRETRQVCRELELFKSSFCKGLVWLECLCFTGEGTQSAFGPNCNVTAEV